MSTPASKHGQCVKTDNMLGELYSLKQPEARHEMRWEMEMLPMNTRQRMGRVSLVSGKKTP